MQRRTFLQRVVAAETAAAAAARPGDHRLETFRESTLGVVAELRLRFRLRLAPLFNTWLVRSLWVAGWKDLQFLWGRPDGVYVRLFAKWNRLSSIVY